MPYYNLMQAMMLMQIDQGAAPTGTLPELIGCGEGTGPFTEADIAAVDEALGALSGEMLDRLCCGDDDGIAAAVAGLPPQTHEMLNELFESIG